MIRLSSLLIATCAVIALPCLTQAENNPAPATQPAAAQPDAAPAPATDNGSAGNAKDAENAENAKNAKKLAITVKSIDGSAAEYRDMSQQDPKWQPLKVSQTLGELCIVSTGLGTTVVLQLEDRNEFVIKPVSEFGIRSARKLGNHAETRVGLKYGAITADVDSSRGTNDTRVSTPVLTMAAKGTGCNLATGDMGTGAQGTHGTWAVTGNGGQSKNLPGGHQTNGQFANTNQINNNQFASNVGNMPGSTGNDKKFLNQFGSGRGLFNFQNNLLNHPPLPECSDSYPPYNPNSHIGGQYSDVYP